jgi:hypothetical protein
MLKFAAIASKPPASMERLASICSESCWRRDSAWLRSGWIRRALLDCVGELYRNGDGALREGS